MKDLIIAPVITEKSAHLGEDGKTYVFKVSKDANKVETALKQRIELANELRQDGDKHGLRFSG